MDAQAFDGVRVVERAQWVFVLVAGALLADWGADVVHVEPLSGDPHRGLLPQGIGAAKSGVNLSMAPANRGKRSLAVDVRNEHGQSAGGIP
jgi:crotonobetainyl-CoA:carnitine CoA-transferase CaiB-like acyl-CoA transferase